MVLKHLYELEVQYMRIGVTTIIYRGEKAFVLSYK